MPSGGERGVNPGLDAYRLSLDDDATDRNPDPQLGSDKLEAEKLPDSAQSPPFPNWGFVLELIQHCKRSLSITVKSPSTRWGCRAGSSPCEFKGQRSMQCNATRNVRGRHVQAGPKSSFSIFFDGVTAFIGYNSMAPRARVRPKCLPPKKNC